MFAIQIQAEALVEIQEVFEWYEAQRQGLGFEFINAFEFACEKLKLNPQHYLSINENFRRFALQRFPFLIVYEIEQESVIIVAVRHSARQPI